MTNEERVQHVNDLVKLVFEVTDPTLIRTTSCVLVRLATVKNLEQKLYELARTEFWEDLRARYSAGDA